jgi:sulfite reductase (NADPH) flavoprotein alpha-component
MSETGSGGQILHLALAAIVAEEGGLGAAAAEDYLQRLQRDRRYQRDVY